MIPRLHTASQLWRQNTCSCFPPLCLAATFHLTSYLPTQGVLGDGLNALTPLCWSDIPRSDHLLHLSYFSFSLKMSCLLYEKEGRISHENVTNSCYCLVGHSDAIDGDSRSPWQLPSVPARLSRQTRSERNVWCVKCKVVVGLTHEVIHPSLSDEQFLTNFIEDFWALKSTITWK